MKTLYIALLSLVVAVGMAASNDASANGHGGHGHSHGHVGVFIGAPLFPYYYSPYWYPRYYYPPAYVAPAGPPEYVEQGGAPMAAPVTGQSGYWYYCQDTQTYYPYVKQCASQWQQVQPQASAAPQ